MEIPDLWLIDLPMLQNVVKLQTSHNGSFPLEELMERVGLLGRGDAVYTGLAPWSVTESLRRLAEGGFVHFPDNDGDDFFSTNDENDEDDRITKLEMQRAQVVENLWPQIEAAIRRLRHDLEKQKADKGRRIKEALFKGIRFDDAHWDDGRFFVSGQVQVYYVRSTPNGLRRVGAWPNPETISDDFIEILSELAQSIEGQQPGEAGKLREVKKVIKDNAVDLSGAFLAKLIAHVAGL